MALAIWSLSKPKFERSTHSNSSITVIGNAVIWTNRQSGQHIVDTRLAPTFSAMGRALLLDELFLELNA